MKKIFKIFSVVLIISILMVSLAVPTFALEAPNGGDIVFDYNVSLFGSENKSVNGRYNVNPDYYDEPTDFHNVAVINYNPSLYYGIYTRISVRSNTDTVLYSSNDDNRFKFSGILVNTSNVASIVPSRLRLSYLFSDGSRSEYQELSSSYVTLNGLHDGNSNFTKYTINIPIMPEKDVVEIVVIPYFTYEPFDASANVTGNVGYGDVEINIPNFSYDMKKFVTFSFSNVSSIFDLIMSKSILLVVLICLVISVYVVYLIKKMKR